MAGAVIFMPGGSFLSRKGTVFHPCTCWEKTCLGSPALQTQEAGTSAAFLESGGLCLLGCAAKGQQGTRQVAGEWAWLMLEDEQSLWTSMWQRHCPKPVGSSREDVAVTEVKCLRNQSSSELWGKIHNCSPQGDSHSNGICKDILSFPQEAVTAGFTCHSHC